MLNCVTPPALAYAARGIPVFPCNEFKRPIVKGGFRSASTDPVAIRAMFAAPGAVLIGVPTGHISGIDVIDIDPRHGGDDWLAANVWRLPETRTHATRSGGRHLLFRANAFVRCSAGRVAPGVDVRGSGGYVIVPPSPGYTVISAAPVRPWPRWLLEPGVVLPPVPPPRPPAPTHAPGPIGSGRLDRYIETMLDTLGRAGKGQKHSALWRAGKAVGGVLHYHGAMSDDAAVEKLLEALPDTVEDWAVARQTARDAIAAGRAAPIVLVDRPFGEARHD